MRRLVNSTYVFIAAFIFVILQSNSLSAQKLEPITLRPGMEAFEPGHSVNRVTSERKGVCIKDAAVSENPRGLSQEITMEIIQSSSDLSRALGVSAYASYFGNSFRTLVGEATASHEERSSFYVRVSVSGLFRTVTNVEPSSAAAALLEEDKTGAWFAKTCGDSFVYQTEEGGEFLAVVSHRAMDEMTRREFFAALSAQWGAASAGTQTDQTVAKISREFEVRATITQVGLASVPPPSLVDPAKLMEHARTFASKLKETMETKPYRVHLQRFEDSPAFQLVILRAKLDRLRDFNPSIQIMEAIVGSYDLALDRSKLVTAALSNPQDFRSFDHSAITRYSAEIGAKVQMLQNLALQCAEKSRGGEICQLPSPTDLAVTPLPEKLAALILTSEVGRYSMRWPNGQATPTRNGGDGQVSLKLGDDVIGYPCLQAKGGLSLIRDTVRIALSPVGGKPGCAWVVCPDAPKTAKAPQHAGECSGSSTEGKICFRLHMSINQGDADCVTDWTLTGAQVNSR